MPSLLASGIASPLAANTTSISSPLAANLSSTATTSFAGNAVESLQLMFLRRDDKFWHHLFHGKTGKPVEPCFNQGSAVWTDYYQGRWKIEERPPWPQAAVRSHVPMHGFDGANDCFYVNDGLGNAGYLECGTPEVAWLRYHFVEDPRVTELLTCVNRNGWIYNRQWWRRMAFVDY